MTKNGDSDREWKLAYYARTIADERVRRAAWHLAEHMRARGDPELNRSDLQCATRYLRKCFLNAGVAELQAMDEADFAGWWARGTIGACRFRAGGQRRPVRREVRNVRHR